MKNLLIILGTIILGTVIFQMMMGNHPDSLKTAVIQVMHSNIEQYAAAGEGTL